jgi:hypothetical protein
MGSYDPFEHLKHKLWPKEGPGIKLPIWLPTTKNQESPWFPSVQVACDKPLESSPQGIQLFFRPHRNQRSARKVMGPQSCGSLGTKCHLDVDLVERHRVYYKGGRWWLPPSSGRGEFCESKFARGSSELQRCSNYVLTNLLFGLCRFVWVIKCLSFFLVPSWSSNTSFYPRSATSQGACPDSLFFHCFHFRLTFESIKEFESVSKQV